MKKLLALTLATVMALSLVACGSGEAEETDTSTQETSSEQISENTETTEDTETTEEVKSEFVTVLVDDAEGNKIEVEFPTDIERIVCLNYQTLDFVDAVGLSDLVVGVVGGAEMPDHLVHFLENEDIVNLGGMKDYDIEAIMSLEPDVIFSSDRSKADYDTFSKIAPTYCAYVSYTEDTFMTAYEKLASDHGVIFGIEDEVADIIASYNARIEAIAEAAEGQTCLLGMVTGDSLFVYHIFYSPFVCSTM